MFPIGYIFINQSNSYYKKSIHNTSLIKYHSHCMYDKRSLIMIKSEIMKHIVLVSLIYKNTVCKYKNKEVNSLKMNSTNTTNYRTVTQLIRYARPVAIILISWNVIFIWETGYWTRAIKRFALFDLLKSLYSDTNILSKYIPFLQKRL